MYEKTNEENLSEIKEEINLNEPVELTDESIEDFRKKGGSIVLFYMPNSKASLIQEDLLRNIFEEFKEKISFGLVNVYDNQEFAIKNGISSFPATMYSKDNETVDVKFGVQDQIEPSIIEII